MSIDSLIIGTIVLIALGALSLGIYVFLVSKSTVGRRVLWAILGAILGAVATAIIALAGCALFLG